MIRRELPVLLLLIAVTSTARADVDFARDVLPILSDACFHCHGPDEAARKGKLRLDSKEGAFRERNGLAAFVPGKSHESEAIRRILSGDPDERMPPPKSNRTLSEKQKETLKAWVDQGAKWGRHWAFEPIRTPAVPHIPGAQSPIDAFIRLELQKQKLTAAPPAPREAWLRRVTLDLTGLPPTVAERDQFLKDQSPEAFERVVDRLLASPRYGERMAADWLDVARFADTHGYQMDRFRPVWPYRDWVIGAFNRNLPYPRFVTEQLAGDLLPNARQDQILATAFNRLHMQNEEGGIVEEEFRVAYVNDRVTTFGTAFLGLTFECSRCHDHKYDPLTQKDYYSLFAFFQNIDECGQTTYFTNATPVPALLLSTPEQERKLAELLQFVRTRESDVRAIQQTADKSFREWLANRPQELPEPLPLAHFSFDEMKSNQFANSRNSKAPAKGHDGPKLTAGHRGQAIALNGENGATFPGIGHFTRSDPFTVSLWLKAEQLAPRAVVLHHSKAPVDAGSRGYELLLESGHVAFGMHHMWPGNSLKVRTQSPIKPNTWTHIAITYDGSSRADGLAIYLDGVPADLRTIRDGLTKDITYGDEPELTLGYRFRDNGFKGGSVDELKLFDRRLTAAEVARTADREVPLQESDWHAYFLATVHEPYQQALQKLREARRDHAKAIEPIPEIMAMKELPQPKPAYILKRGQYDMPGEPVGMTTPSVLPPFPADLPRNRLGLAQWLTKPDHPLFYRVAANRLWQQMFGTGLVETSDNFGSQGSPPSHPALLDWLAADYARDGDTKRMLKQIALSETYRQSSVATADQRSIDPTNRWLARFPVRRLSAEMLRDQALAVSGLLVEKLGGPSVKPYQPDGLWDMSMGRPKYDRSKGDDLYRRSLYTFVKRTAPHPQQMTFDGADRSNCTVRRQATSTPLQSLALLNDVQFVEASRMLAQQLMTSGTAESEYATTAFRIVTGRTATDAESAILSKLYQRQKSYYTANSGEARKLLTTGDKPADAKLDPAALAAATMVCQALLNHDEAVNCR